MKTLFLSLAALCLLSACQDVIEVDLNSAAPTLVVEAPLFPDVSVQTFTLSLSTDYFNPETPATVPDATITVTDGAGKVYGFSHTADGVYTCDSLVPVTGQTYTLSLAYAGKTYTSASVMQPVTAIDSLVPLSLTGGPGGGGVPSQETSYRIQCFFRDAAGEGDTYRIKYFLNGVYDSGYDLLYSDVANNGQLAGVFPFGLSAQSGDTVRVELSAIDDGLYDYFNTLSQLTASNGPTTSAAPANPTSNISGGAMGYFGAFQRQVATVVVK